MNAIKRFFHDFWTMPLPEFIVEKIGALFHPFIYRIKVNKLSRATYFKLTLALILFSLMGIVILSGTFNPIDLLFDIPYLSVDEYLISISNYNSYTWAEYFAFSGTCAIIVLGLLNLFVFKGENYKISTLQGFAYTIMAILISMIVDLICQDVFRVIHERYITDSLADPLTLLAALLANLTIYFVLDGALESSLSFSITPTISRTLNVNLFDLGLIHYILIAIVFKIVIMIIDKIGIWEIIIDFIKKWCYTPKYIVTITFYFYFFIPIIAIRLAFPDFYKKIKSRFSKNPS